MCSTRRRSKLATFPGVELVESERAPGRPARFTTRELLAVEREALEIALTGRDVGAPRAAPGGVPIEERAALSDEQRALVREACMSSDRVVCVVGVAGAGKTTALRVPAPHTARPASRPRRRAQWPRGRRAGDRDRDPQLDHAPAAPRRQPEGGLPRGCVLVVDEAGMAETRILGPLLRLVDDAGGKAILVGDPGQLPAVGAGGLFPALCDRLGVSRPVGEPPPARPSGT